MGASKRLIELGIRNILVVDDTPENVEGARKYFMTLEPDGIRTDMTLSAEEANEMIRDAYRTDGKYGLVLSDMEMEEKKSGLVVIYEAFKHEAYGFIVTGRNYDRDRTHGHGPSTLVEPGSISIPGKKDIPETWESVLNGAIGFMEGDDKGILAGLKRHEKYVGEPSEEIGKMAVKRYSHL